MSFLERLLKAFPASKNFEDRTNYVNRRLDPMDLPHWGSSIHNSLTGEPPLDKETQARFQALNHIGKTLTPEERDLLENKGFGLPDIQLMRIFKANPQDIINSWMLRQGTAD